MTVQELQEQEARFAVWERRLDQALTVLPYVVLVIPTVLTAVTFADKPRSYWLVLLGLVGAAAAWMLFMVTLRCDPDQHPALACTYYAGLIILLGALIVASPWYGFFAFAGYIHALWLLPGRWKLAGLAATSVMVALSQAGGHVELTPSGVVGLLLIACANMALSGTLSFLGWTSYVQTDKRKRMVADLAAAYEQLEAAMEENAALHAQLLAQAREGGATDERQRLAREIHDTLAQGLTGIITQLEAAGQAEHEPAEWRRHLANAARLARESLAEARRSVRALGPAPLERARLPEALAEVAGKWSSVSGVPAKVAITGTARPLHPEIEATLLRTAQEALANVAKHAAASRAGLTLSYMEDVVTLDVRDDGVGFDPAGVPGDGDGDASGGFGLTSMRQRVRRLAGTLTVESEPGGGTAVSATVPAVPVAPEHRQREEHQQQGERKEPAGQHG
jgi:signal transduction histidine kinase